MVSFTTNTQKPGDEIPPAYGIQDASGYVEARL